MKLRCSTVMALDGPDRQASITALTTLRDNPIPARSVRMVSVRGS
jgi:hypothetical protein